VRSNRPFRSRIGYYLHPEESVHCTSQNGAGSPEGFRRANSQNGPFWRARHTAGDRQKSFQPVSDNTHVRHHLGRPPPELPTENTVFGGKRGGGRNLENGPERQGQGRPDLACQISAGKTGRQSLTIFPDGPLEADGQVCWWNRNDLIWPKPDMRSYCQDRPAIDWLTSFVRENVQTKTGAFGTVSSRSFRPMLSTRCAPAPTVKNAERAARRRPSHFTSQAEPWTGLQPASPSDLWLPLSARD